MDAGCVLEPPPTIRCIVDKTAEFVAQNGVEFEMQILSNEKKNPTFNFLKAKDAYHPYYQQRILEFLYQGQSPMKTPTRAGK
jgi:splicing factor 3A subunit 1